MVASEFAEKIAKLKTAFENVFLKKNLGSNNGGKNVVTNANGDIITEAKPTIPSASTTIPSADTTSGSYGSGTDYARANHTHSKSTLYAESNHTHEYLSQTNVLPSGADLNDSTYRSPGLYAIPGATSKTILNRPFPDTILTNNSDKFAWLKIELYNNNGTTRAIQIYYSMNTGYEHIFYRTAIKGGWNDWKKLANIDEIPTKVSDLTNDSGFTSYTHPSGIGTALTTATLKKIAYDSQGHITGVADAPTASTSASGIVQLNDNTNSTSTTQAATANVVKKTYDEFSSSSKTTKNGHTHTDTEITYTGSTSNSISSIDLAAYEEFNANRLAFLDKDNIIVEYTTNANVDTPTWTAFPSSRDNDKIKLVTTSAVFTAGNGATASANNQVRVTIDAGGTYASSNANGVSSKIYVTIRKMLIYASTGGGTNCKCKVEIATYNEPDTWINKGTYPFAGQFGWNSIPLYITCGGNPSQLTTRTRYIRMTFSTESAKNVNVSKIRMIGETCYYPTLNDNSLANTGHIYQIDENKNATFPAKIIKQGGTSNQFLKADGSIDENTYLTTTNASSTYVAKENGKGLFTGSYNDLTNKPSYTPTVTSETSGAYEIGSINISGSDVTLYGKDTNTNTIGYQLRTNSTALTASDKTYRYRLLLEVGDGTYMPVNTSTSTSATADKSGTMNTREFMIGGDIRLYNTTTAINANATFSATVLWQQYNLNLGYSFNNTGSALTLTVNSPVYMIAKQSSSNPSKATLNTPYFTQTLPNTEDGLLYIQLGYATSETQIELTPHHPIYEYRNGSIQKFSLETHVHTPQTYTHTSDLINTTSGYFSDNCQIQFYKIGKIVIANFRVLSSTNLTTSYVNFVTSQHPIPEAYRPNDTIIHLGHCHFNTETPSILTTQIYTDGTIAMRINTSTRVVNTYYQVVYITD